MHNLIYTEEQPNSFMNATCFYGSDDTLHDKPPSCMNSPAQINHTTVVTKEVIYGRFSWSFSGSINPSGSLDEIICLKGNPYQLPRKTHATVSQMPFKSKHTQDKEIKTKEEIQTMLCIGHMKHSKINFSSNFT